MSGQAFPWQDGGHSDIAADPSPCPGVSWGHLTWGCVLMSRCREGPRSEELELTSGRGRRCGGSLPGCYQGDPQPALTCESKREGLNMLYSLRTRDLRLERLESLREDGGWGWGGDQPKDFMGVAQ